MGVAMRMLVIKVLLFLSIFSNVYAEVHISEACDLACALVASDGSILDKEAARERVVGKLRAITVKTQGPMVNEADLRAFVARERLSCCPCGNVPNKLREAFNVKLVRDVQENYSDKAAPLAIFSLGSGALKQERDIAQGLLEAGYTNIVFAFVDLVYAEDITAVENFCQSFGSNVNVASSGDGVLSKHAGGTSIRVVHFGNAEDYIEAAKRDERLRSNVFLNIDPSTIIMPVFSKRQLVEKVAALSCDPEFTSAKLQHSGVLQLSFSAADEGFTKCRLIKKGNSVVIHFDEKAKAHVEARAHISRIAFMGCHASSFQKMLQGFVEVPMEDSPLVAWSYYVDTNWLFFNVMEHTRNLDAPLLSYKVNLRTVFDFREAFDMSHPRQGAAVWMHGGSPGDFLVMDRSGSLRQLR